MGKKKQPIQIDPAEVLAALDREAHTSRLMEWPFARAFTSSDDDQAPEGRIAGVRIYAVRDLRGTRLEPCPTGIYVPLAWDLEARAIVVRASGAVDLWDTDAQWRRSAELGLPKRLPPRSVTVGGRAVPVKPEWLTGKTRAEKVFSLVRQLLNKHADAIYGPPPEYCSTSCRQLVAVIDDPELLDAAGGVLPSATRDWPKIAEVLAHADASRWKPARGARARWERSQAELFDAAKRRARARKSQLKKLMKKVEGAPRTRHFVNDAGEYFGISIDFESFTIGTSAVPGERMINNEPSMTTGRRLKNETLERYLAQVEHHLKTGYREVSASTAKRLARKRKTTQRNAVDDKLRAARALAAKTKRSKWQKILVDGPWGKYMWGDPVPPKEIAAIKKRLGLAVPKELAAFLRVHQYVLDDQNCALVDGEIIIEATLEVRANYADWEDAETEGLLVFNDSWLGNGDLYGYQGGKIVVFDHETGETKVVAASLEELLEQQIRAAAKAA